jgi:dienelactone hydrolase
MLSLIGLFTGCRTADPRRPEGVLKSELKVKLTGKEVTVDFHLPQGLKQAPVVVVAHGFSRSRLNMAGWGGLLASNGFIVAIPDLPAWSDHERNSRAIRELLARINSKAFVTEPTPNGNAALMGFSMGGLCSLLAAATNDQVRCWVGLDPVDSGQKGAEAAKQLQIPCAVIQAEPSRCNADGNAKQIVASLPGPLFALRVQNGTHTDPEQPTDWLAELVCGKADPTRRAIFERYTIAALKSVFFGDALALATLAATTNDAGVKVLTTRALKDFKP